MCVCKQIAYRYASLASGWPRLGERFNVCGAVLWLFGSSLPTGSINMGEGWVCGSGPAALCRRCSDFCGGGLLHLEVCLRDPEISQDLENASYGLLACSGMPGQPARNS